MKRNLLLYGSIILILVSLAFNISYASKRRLDEPVFFDHYIEIPLIESYGSTYTFQLQYVVNHGDDIDAYSIRMTDIIGNYEVIIQSQSTQQYSRYDLKTLSIKIKFGEDYYHEIPDKQVIEKAQIFFSGGKQDVMEVDFGKLILKKSDSYDDRYIYNMITSSSNHHESVDIFKVKQDIVINSIESELKDEVSDLLNMSILVDDSRDKEIINNINKDIDTRLNLYLDDVDYINFSNIKYPISVSDSLGIRTQFNMDYFSVYRLYLTINYTTLDGEEHSININNSRYYPNFSDSSIEEYLESRGYINV